MNQKVKIYLFYPLIELNYTYLKKILQCEISFQISC